MDTPGVKKSAKRTSIFFSSKDHKVILTCLESTVTQSLAKDSRKVISVAQEIYINCV